MTEPKPEYTTLTEAYAAEGSDLERSFDTALAMYATPAEIEAAGYSLDRSGEYRKCLVCGKIFYMFPCEVAKRPGLYCSIECNGVAHRGENNCNYKGKVKRICQHCGKEFEAYPAHVKQGRSKYCSVECRGKGRRVARVEYPCDGCDEILEISISRFKISDRHFCSHDCYAKSKIVSNEESKKTVLRECTNCRKEFWASSYDVKKGMGKFCSLHCSATWRVHNGTRIYNRGKGGKREDLDGLYVRSSWEANWARYLNWLIDQGVVERWEYEPETFEFEGIKRGTRFYTPDFKVYFVGGKIEYHEVKGYMNAQGRTRMKRMAKYYPEIPLVLVDRPVYKAVEKDVKPFIPNWESSR